MKRRTFVRSSLTAAVAASLSTRRSLAAALYQEAPQAPPDVDAITGAGGEVTLSGKDIADLASRMRGRVLLAGDDGYDEARQILNPSFDKRPALIAQPTGTADVRSAVDFAREHDNLLLDDFDGDGDLDIITTEENGNTGFHFVARGLGLIWHENPLR